MGYNEYELSLPCSAPEAELRAAIARKAKLGSFEYSIVLKSLDARHKDRIAWLYRVGVRSAELMGGTEPKAPALEHSRTKRGGRVAVAGTGPAGIFAALYLARSGFKVTVLERGSRVDGRKAALDAFEAGGPFPAADNYAFGEGGAGTFSDGKLSSRTKGISAEREYLFSEFVAAGAPDEIRYMTHPHVGSDILYAMTPRLRLALEEAGGSIEFGARVDDLVLSNGKLSALDTSRGRFEADAFVLACGHSSFDTQRMLMSRGVPFRAKNFALGFRAEHEQAAINRAQWGVKSLPGVKAAEYRLTAQSGDTGVYSFCMCPGGTVVPAAAFPDASVVNGKSDYARNGRWANAAVVAGVSLNALLGEELSPERALDWLEALERRFKDFAGGWRAPAMTVRDFMAGRSGTALPPSSYPLGLMAANLAELLPAAIVPPLREGLAQFCRKLRGYEDGIILGLESKTSAAIQALRDPEAMTAGYDNLYIAGEGSGWSGGIVSSAADGLKAAQALAARY
jgi:uncharacterized FAD-dependent dehydrogenase